MARHRTDDECPLRTRGSRVGDYRIERELRSEDTGLVYAATHLVLPRRAAVKVMHPAQAYMRALAVQILREACVLEALSHPGVPRVYECGVLDDKRPWVALELITGDTVAELVARQPLALGDLVMMVQATADVLEHAHARGVVHNRLTDASIVRTPTRAVRVLGARLGRCRRTRLQPRRRTERRRPRSRARRVPRAHRQMMREGDSMALLAPTVPAELAALIDDDGRARTDGTTDRGRGA